MKKQKTIETGELGFTALQNPSRWGEKKGAFVASVQYSQRIGPDKLAAIIAKRSGRNEFETRMMLNCVSSTIFEEVAKGNFVDLGILQIGLSISGTLQTVNAPFDPKKNRVNVTYRTSHDLSAAVRQLKPVNVSDIEKPILYEVMSDGGPDKNVIVPNVRVIANIVHALINNEAADEGIWLETLDGGKAYKAELLLSDRSSASFRFNGTLVPGKYRLAFYSRNGDPSAGVTAVRRLVTV